MSKFPQFPSVPLTLITELEARFPGRVPDQIVDHATFAQLVGEQRVVRFLRQEFDKQNNPKEV